MSNHKAEQLVEEAWRHEYFILLRARRLAEIGYMKAAWLAAPSNALILAGLRERIEHAWHNHDEEGRVSISMADAQMLVEQVLAPNPEKKS